MNAGLVSELSTRGDVQNLEIRAVSAQTVGSLVSYFEALGQDERLYVLAISSKCPEGESK